MHRTRSLRLTESSPGREKCRCSVQGRLWRAGRKEREQAWGEGRARGQQFEGQVLCLEQGAPMRERLPREGMDLGSGRLEKGLSAMLSSSDFSSCRHRRVIRDWGEKATGCFTNVTPVAKRKKVCKWEREGAWGAQSGGLCNCPGQGQPGEQ